MENTNQKNSTGTIAMVVIGIVIVALLAYVLMRKPIAQAPIDNTPVASISGDTTNFLSFSIAPGATVSGVMPATGTLTGAYFFEANMVVQILDANKNLIKSAPGTATTDWMTSDAVSFTTVLDFTGIPAGMGYIRLHNDNASGLPENDRYIDIPVVFQ